MENLNKYKEQMQRANHKTYNNKDIDYLLPCQICPQHDKPYVVFFIHVRTNVDCFVGQSVN